MGFDPRRQILPPGDDWESLRAAFRWNVPERLNIAERCCDSWAEADPDRVAMIAPRDGGEPDIWTYGRLKRASDGFAAALAAQGVQRGDRVAVLLPQCPQVMVAQMGAYKLGAIVLPLFTLFGPDALRYRLADSGARALVTDAENLPKIMELRADLQDLKVIYTTGPAAAPVRSFDADCEAGRTIPRADTAAEDPACLIYTSGTTGDPKGVLHAHRFLLGHMPSVEAHHDRFPIPGDVGWTPADWAWIGGLMDLAIPCLYYGVPLVAHRMRKFDADAAYALIRDHAIRNLFLPPTALKLMRQARVPSGLNVRSIGSGGEALGADLLDWGRSALGAPINELYGQTECNLVTTSSAGLMEVRPGSMGRAVPGFDVAVIDEGGNPVPPGELGEIAVRRGTPVMFLKYWNKPEKTAEKFRGDWLRTGDLGRCDEDGYFWYVSRDDDVITSAGYRVGPSEIEACLMGHEAVVMAAAIGVPDPLRGEVVKAFVVLRDGNGPDGLEEELIARVKARISPHVAPRAVEFVESLPMTATGKIMRRALRDQPGGGA